MANTNDFILGPEYTGQDHFDPGRPLDEQAEAATEEMQLEAEARLLHEYNEVTRCFRSPSGRVWLEWLRSKTIEQPAFWPQDGYPVQLTAEQQGFIREGQNMLYREIIRMMDVADKGPSEQLQRFIEARKEAET